MERARVGIGAVQVGTYRIWSPWEDAGDRASD